MTEALFSVIPLRFIPACVSNTPHTQKNGEQYALRVWLTLPIQRDVISHMKTRINFPAFLKMASHSDP